MSVSFYFGVGEGESLGTVVSDENAEPAPDDGELGPLLERQGKPALLGKKLARALRCAPQISGLL
jgi:hypothetical protein